MERFEFDASEFATRITNEYAVLGLVPKDCKDAYTAGLMREIRRAAYRYGSDVGHAAAFTAFQNRLLTGAPLAA